MRLQQYINEANTASATNMELAIVQANNGEPLKHPKFKNIADNIVTFLHDNGVVGDGEHLGSGTYPITEFWQEHGGTDGTPKTDLIIGNDKISLKKAGGSQLMSGKKGESRATFYAAINQPNMKTKTLNMVDKIENYFNKFVEGKNPLNITQQKKSGTASKEVLEADKMHKKLSKELSKMFENDNQFMYNFIQEAMSGNVKFDTDSKASASHILVFDPINGTDNKYHSVNDRSYIMKKAKSTKINVSWKSTSRKTKEGKIYNYFSVIRLLSKKTNEEILKHTNNGKNELNEGIISSISKNIKMFFKNIWNRIKRWLSESMENILKFFNLEPIIKPIEIKF